MLSALLRVAAERCQIVSSHGHVTRAQTPVMHTLSSLRLATVFFFALHPGCFPPLILQEREKQGEAGEGWKAEDTLKARLGSIYPPLVPIHVLMWTFRGRNVAPMRCMVFAQTGCLCECVEREGIRERLNTRVCLCGSPCSVNWFGRELPCSTVITIFFSSPQRAFFHPWPLKWYVFHFRRVHGQT